MRTTPTVCDLWAIMELVHHETVEASREHVWAAFMDLKRIGRCFPGAEVTTVHGDDFTGKITVKVGPLSLTFLGEGTLEIKDKKDWHARIASTGQESHGIGKADIAIDIYLSEPAAGTGTDVDIRTDLNVHGLPRWIGGSIAQRVASPLVRSFVRCMAR